MRKSVVVAIGVLLLLAAGASAKKLNKGPRLDGSFRVVATVQANDIGLTPGAVTTDVYDFDSTCGGSGGCAKVNLTRDAGGRDIKSVLHRTAPGIYKGNEGPAPYVCINPIGAKGTYTGEHKITVTKSKNGRAQKISGKSGFHFSGCDETFEGFKLTGKLTQ